ncbi:hypothetical protein AZI87_06170 [Bdellovibrio bacteriovorus]|uniref:Uncharacterized protein n=1 Tax=Bdellovibrio bacteriovorus TaxID=959 RepID=A0A162GRZ7_BDEBC|nr:hypothetical protein [Bdellovibrio bacteriovorus]KYG68811.1 hypothetical protein AZI87_06170 [Bdellovibrio bacteriovorus]
MKSFVLIVSFFISSICSAASPSAVYEIPGVEDPDLAHYEIESLKLDINEDDIRIDYVLPLDLTGAKNRIRAEGVIGPDSKANLRGPHSDFVCDLIQEKCDVRYNDLTIDESLVRARLEGKKLSSTQIEQRLQVTRRFSGDPIGIIHLK